MSSNEGGALWGFGTGGWVIYRPRRILLGQPFQQDWHNETGQQGIERHGNACIGAGNWIDFEGARRADAMGRNTNRKSSRLPLCDRQDVHQRGHGNRPDDSR